MYVSGGVEARSWMPQNCLCIALLSGHDSKVAADEVPSKLRHICTSEFFTWRWVVKGGVLDTSNATLRWLVSKKEFFVFVGEWGILLRSSVHEKPHHDRLTKMNFSVLIFSQWAFAHKKCDGYCGFSCKKKLSRRTFFTKLRLMVSHLWVSWLQVLSVLCLDPCHFPSWKKTRLAYIAVGVGRTCQTVTAPIKL